MQETHLVTARSSWAARLPFQLKRSAVAPLMVLGLMAPMLLLPTRQAQAQFAYDADIPGVNESVVTRSATYRLTDSTPVTGDIELVNAGMTTAQIRNIINDTDGGTVNSRTIVFQAGTYRIGDITLTRPVTLRSAENASVYLDGAVPVDTWADTTPTNGVAGPVWSTNSANFEFPSTTVVYGPDEPRAGDTKNVDYSVNALADDGEMVFRDGRPLVQRGGLAQVDSLTEFHINRDANRIYVFTGGGAPATNSIEITRYNFAFDLPFPQADNSTLSGLNFRRYAGAGPEGTATAPQGQAGAAVFLFSQGSTIDKCSFFWNGHTGLHTKANRNTITRSHFVSNGGNGIVGAAQGVKVSGNYIAWNNAEGFHVDWGAAGIKVTSFDTTSSIYDNFLEGNKASGIWLDVGSAGNVFRNYIKGGTRYGSGPKPLGIFIELSSDSTVAFNLVTNTGGGVYIANSANVRVFNNTLSGNEVNIGIKDALSRNGNQIPRVTGTRAVNNISMGATWRGLEAAAADGVGEPSLERFGALNFNVHHVNSQPMISWKNSDNALVTYPNLTAFRDAATADTGSLEANGIQRTPAIFEGGLDFRVKATETEVANGATIPVSTNPDVSNIRGFMRDSNEFPFVFDALNRWSGLPTATRNALATLVGADNSPQKYRGAFEPSGDTSLAAPATTSTSPSGGTG